MSHMTKEGIEVKKGQIWRDLDKRCAGRRVMVINLGTHSHNGPVAIVKSMTGNEPKGRESTISIARMYKHSTGFELVTPTPTT